MANKQIKHLMLKLLGQDTEEVMDIYDEKAVHIANDVTKADISKDPNSNNYKVTWYTQDSPAKGRTLLLNNDGGLFRTFDYSSGSLVTDKHWDLATKDFVTRKGDALSDAYVNKSGDNYYLVMKTGSNTGAQLIMGDSNIAYQTFANGTYTTKSTIPVNPIASSKIVTNLTSSDNNSVLAASQGKALNDKINVIGARTTATGQYTTAAWATGSNTCIWNAPAVGTYIIWCCFIAHTDDQNIKRAYKQFRIATTGSMWKPYGMYATGGNNGEVMGYTVVLPVFITAVGQKVTPYIHCDTAGLVFDVDILALRIK